jgi:molybdopterin-guanine dinucleotide biosynthesis protein A
VTNKALAGLILCGGESRRMGSPKALMEVAGEPLIVRVARRLSAVADPVLLAPASPGRFGDLGFAEVEDARAGAGPLGGLVAGLVASPHLLLAAVAVDMPFASAEVFRLLADRHTNEDAVAPRTATGLEPLHAVYSRTALPAFREALDAGRFGLREALAGIRVKEVTESEWRAADPTGRFALNVNRPEDLSLLDQAPPSRPGPSI